MSISLILIIVSIIIIVGLLFVFSLCAAAKQSDNAIEKAFIEMLENERNITSGCPVILEK